ATNQGVVGSNPASRATYAERRGLPETEALFRFRPFAVVPFDLRAAATVPAFRLHPRKPAIAASRLAVARAAS
ncbi:hypothetical protein, partial [Cupriavidus necator]